MPTAYATGTAIAILRTGGYADGVLDVSVASPAGAADGTLDVDRRTARAFFSRVRLVRPEVYVEDFGVPLNELVESVEVSERLDDLVPTATFTIAKAEGSPFHPDTILSGNRPCRIELWIGPPGGVGDVNYTRGGSIGFGAVPASYFDDGVFHSAIIGPGGLAKYPLFDGYTDSMSDSAAYRTRAQVQTIAASSLWADVVGCVRLDAFSNRTRAEILAMLAESCGVTLTGLQSLPSGRVKKPIDEMSRSVLELIRRYGEIEGWRARLSKDGEGIEVLSEDTLLSGSPVFAFDEANSFNVSVSTPPRPVTDWIVSGTEISKPIPEATYEDEGPTVKTTVNEGLDADGNPIRMIETVESWGGAERRRISEVYRTIAPDGDPPLGAAYQLSDRTVIVTEWADFVWYDDPVRLVGFHTRPSAQMSKRTTETYSFGSTPASAEYSVTYEWGGGRWLTPNAELTLVERTTEIFTWNTAKCRLEWATNVVERPFSPRVDPNVDTFYTYSDGSARADEFYIMQEVERFAVTWTELEETGSAPKTTMQELHSCWNEQESPDTEDVFEDVYRQTDIGTIVWQGNGSNTEHTKTTTIISLGAMNSTEVETIEGPVPGAPRGSTETPSFQQEVILKIFRASAASGYIKREESPSAIDFAESLEELETWARRRVRRDHSRVVTVTHRLLPYLRVGDFVTVTCTPKAIDAVEGYVTEIRRSVNALNGGAHQTTVVAVPPTWV